MEQSTCRVAGCVDAVLVKKRQLCRRHYHAAWSAGKLDDVAIWRHTITSYNEATMIGACTECGPDVRVFSRRGRACCWRSSRQTQTSNRHGLTRTDLDAAILAVGGRCQVCRDPFSDENPYCVDHDHACCPGKESCGDCIRGFLCRRCNVGIGMLGDDPERVKSAADYLAKLKKLPIRQVEKTPY